MGQSGESMSKNRAFAIGIVLNLGFVIIEVIYGLIANSSALLADAGHNASDVLGLVFAWTATYLSTLKPKGNFTYGLKKTTILVSILNAVLLFGAVIAIGWDAVSKLSNPVDVGGSQVMIVAGIGTIINTATALLFIKGQKSDLNIRGAYLHMAADAIVSLGVVAAGLLITLTGKMWIDPVMSFIVIAVILYGTWKLFVDSLKLAIDAVPKDVDMEDIKSLILNKQGVSEIHDFHIWAVSTTENILTAHLVMPDGYNDSFLNNINKELKEKFNISHTTFQIENKNMSNKCDACE